MYCRELNSKILITNKERSVSLLRNKDITNEKEKAIRKISSEIEAWFAKQPDCEWLSEKPGIFDLIGESFYQAQVRYSVEDGYISITNNQNKQTKMNTDELLMYAHELYSYNNEDYLKNLFFLVKESENMLEASDYAAEIYRIQYNILMLSAAYRNTELYMSQFYKLKSAMPELPFYKKEGR